LEKACLMTSTAAFAILWLGVVESTIQNQIQAAPRAPAAQMMSTMFSGRGFYVGAVAVGNHGFDPLGLAADTAATTSLRNAELKHGRLAMLAAVAWPLQEMLHPKLASALGARAVLTPSGLTPTIFNGGLDQPEVTQVLAFGAVVMATSEIRDIQRRSRLGLKFNEWGTDSVAGALGFDPLDIATDLPATERFELQEAEMLNGRLAMLSVVAFAVQEMLWRTPVGH